MALAAEPVFALDRFAALSLIESGDRDQAVGPVGEISRYQMAPAVWRQYSTLPVGAATNPFTARTVAKAIMHDRMTMGTRGWAVTIPDANVVVSHEQFYLLWHCPARAFHPTRADQEIAARFANLCNTK
ncbi:MAG: hypothetical protein WCS42_08660 [Verrucomicrobiota bacterium]